MQIYRYAYATCKWSISPYKFIPLDTPPATSTTSLPLAACVVEEPAEDRGHRARAPLDAAQEAPQRLAAPVVVHHGARLAEARGEGEQALPQRTVLRGEPRQIFASK